MYVVSCGDVVSASAVSTGESLQQLVKGLPVDDLRSSDLVFSGTASSYAMKTVPALTVGLLSYVFPFVFAKCLASVLGLSSVL